MRAVMPGYENYFYKEGKIPTHTKESFYKYNILKKVSINTTYYSMLYL